MNKTKLLGVAAAAAVIIWASAQWNGWDNVWGAKADSNAATAPSQPAETPSGSEAPGSSPAASADEPAGPSDAASPSASPSDKPGKDDGGKGGKDGGQGDNGGKSDNDDAAASPEVTDSLAKLLDENAPASTVDVNDKGLAVINNASSLLVLVNKKRNLPSDYAPKDLVIPNVEFSFYGDSPKKQMRKEAADALEKLFKGAADDKIELKAVSGYRSYASQKAIFDRNADQKGEDEANRTSAHPGQSEHQTGLAMDVSSKSAGYELEPKFGETKEGKWLAAHAHEYGFIIRYPKGKESITGYSYEPWHVRYLGKDLAAEVYKSGLTLEEYMESHTSATKA